MSDGDLEVVLGRLVDAALAARPPAPAAPPPVAYSLKDASSAVGVSESHLRREVHAGRLLARLVGTRYLVGHDDLKAWFESLPEADTYRTPYRQLRNHY